MDSTTSGSSSALAHGRPQCPLRNLDTLPAEILIQIMVNCDSVADIRSLMSASPVALSCFRANRRQIMRSTCARFDAQLSGEFLPMYMFAAHLRLLQEEHGHVGSHALESRISQHLKSLLSPYPGPWGMWPGPKHIPSAWKDSLPKLGHLTRVASEAEAIVTGCTTDVWENMRRDFEPLQLSATERATALETVLRVDIFHNAFFCGGKALFQGKHPLLNLILATRVNGDTPSDALPIIFNFYTVLNFLLRRVLLLVKRVESSQDTDGVEGLWAFKARSELQEKNFLLCLCSQGYPMLSHLEGLDEQGLREFVCLAFIRVLSSPKPLFFKEDHPGPWGIALELYWGGCGHVRNMPPGEMKWLWDEDRARRLGLTDESPSGVEHGHPEPPSCVIL